MSTFRDIKVKPGQSIVDLSIQEYGNPEGMLLIIKDNDFNAETDLIAGQTLKIQDSPDFANIVVETINNSGNATSNVVAEFGQSLWDLAVQNYGSIENIMILIQDNNLKKLADTPVLTGDKFLIHTKASVKEKSVMKYFLSRKIKVNTGDTSSVSDKRDGIGYMRVGSNFKVS